MRVRHPRGTYPCKLGVCQGVHKLAIDIPPSLPVGTNMCTVLKRRDLILRMFLRLFGEITIHYCAPPAVGNALSWEKKKLTREISIIRSYRK